jgi:site-specific recombinase XerC
MWGLSSKRTESRHYPKQVTKPAKKQSVAKLPSWDYPFKLANDGHDTRAIQHYLGHKNIQHTVRYTELSAERFKGFWGD